MNVKFGICGEKRFIRIDETLYAYIFDSLKWVNSYQNRTIRKKGINLAGSTYFDGKGKQKLKKIIEAWLKIFSCSPESFILTGNYNLADNIYQESSFSKERVLSQLKELINKTDEAILKDTLLVCIREKIVK